MKKGLIFKSLPNGCSFSNRRTDVAFITVPGTASGDLTGIQLKGVDRWAALRRTDYWMLPHFGSTWAEVPAECQLLIGGLSDGRFCCCIPLVTQDTRCALQGAADGLTLRIHRDTPEPESQPLLAVGVGDDADDVIESMMALIAEEVGGFRIRKDKARPNFMDHFGWCTWDAFYHKVTEKKVRAGLKSFADKGLACGFMILDDGWADTRDDYLCSFNTNAKKFPKGLAETVTRLKQDFDLKSFGLWHCFEGYWGGLDPDGELAKEYRIHHSRPPIRPWLENPAVDGQMVDPADIGRFYRDWYAILRRAGVNMVKVDGQSALDMFTDNLTEADLPRVESMTAYQEAFQGNGMASFHDGLLHCMCLSNDVLFRLYGSNACRNSDDYFPHRPLPVQQRHIVLNAYNNLLTQSVCWPDWDMFQSHGPCAVMHAMSRAISGGPVYVCDKPGKQDETLLKKIVCTDGRVPRFDQPARVTLDRILVNTAEDKKLLKVHNTAGDRAVIGIFHVCQSTEAPIKDTWKVADVPSFIKGRYAIWAHESGRLSTATAKSRASVTLNPGEGEVLTIAPITKGIAVLGLLDMYAGAAAVAAEQVFSGGRLIQVQDGGLFGAYTQEQPRAVFVDGKRTRPNYDAETKLLAIKLKDGPHSIEILQ